MYLDAYARPFYSPSTSSPPSHLQFSRCTGTVLDAVLVLFVCFGLGGVVAKVPCRHLSEDEEMGNPGTEAWNRMNSCHPVQWLGLIACS